MEKALSLDEKIKRAEEISLRRKGETIRTEYEKDDIYGSISKKNINFKKMIYQTIICIVIYIVYYIANSSNIVFANTFINKTNEILSYNINLKETANVVLGQLQSFINNLDSNEEDTINTKNEENKTENIDLQSQENINNQDEQNLESANNQNVDNIEEGIGGENTENKNENSDAATEENTSLTEEEQMKKDSEEIKNKISFIKPISGRISSKFGLRNPTTTTVPKNHTGLDIAAVSGTKIYSATNGTVVLASSEGDYGNHLEIQIEDVTIIYAHCKTLLVKEGENISQGQEIAEVGSTGNSTGPHLHFEIRKDNRLVDPQMILDF